LKKLIQTPLNNNSNTRLELFKFKFITEAKDFCDEFDDQYKNSKKILDFKDYLKENLLDTPENYIENEFRKLKTKFEKIFSDKDLGLDLLSCEYSKYSKLYDNLSIKFQDPSDEMMYDLLITIDLKEALPKKSDDENFDPSKSITKCQIRFKKYDSNNGFELLSEIVKNVNIKDLNKDLLYKLKIESSKED